MKQLVMLSMIGCWLVGCVDDQPFVKHALMAEKKGTCTGQPADIKMVSNTNGERYTFTACLPDGYQPDKHTVTRNGDTLFVSLNAAGQVQHQLTLDIDAKPRYNFIKIGEELLAIAPGSY